MLRIALISVNMGRKHDNISGVDVINKFYNCIAMLY